MHIRDRYIHLPHLKFNKVIKILTLSEGLSVAGYYMLITLSAIYLQEKLTIKPLETIAFASSIYLLSRSLFQIPIAQFLDNHKGFVDEVVAIALSCVLMGGAVIGFIFIENAWHLYALQFVFGLGMSLNLPAWRKMFAKSLDSGHEGEDYGFYDVIKNIFVAIGVWFGGYVVATQGGFELFFVMAGGMIVLGGIVVLFLYKKMNLSTCSQI